MPTWKLTLEYDGTRYRGWQSQKNTDRTVQGAILRAARELLGDDGGVSGAGRTDAGVHALAQVAHFKARKALPESESRGASTSASRPTSTSSPSRRRPPRFHARHDAVSRTYLYRISRRRTAFDKPFVWWVKDRLDLRRDAARREALRGRHDFASFCENPEGQESTLVVVEKCDVVEVGQEIHFRVTASHFLWKMVRRLAGTLVEVGRGNLDAAGVEKLFREKSTTPAKWTAPPSGLFLEKVKY